MTDNENSANQIDEDNLQRGPATCHQLEPVDDENESKKARVARNVFHIRGEDGVKFDVNEEAWSNAELAIRATCESALIDGMPQGWRRTRNPADEGSAAVLLGQGD